MLLNTRTYSPHRQLTTDSVTYAGPAHTLSSKDTLELRAIDPKPAKGFPGVARPSAKLTETQAIGTTTSDLILNLTGSIPVGTSVEAIEAKLADMAAFCASQEARDLFVKLDINA